VYHVIDHFLAIVRDVSAFVVVASVEIQLSHIQRIFAKMAGDIVDDMFYQYRALRTAEATKCGVRLRICFAAHGTDIDIGQEVSVIQMTDRTGSDRAGQIGGKSGARQHLYLDAENQSFVVVTGFIVVVEFVAFARHQHVIVAICTELDRSLQFERTQSSNTSP
jgi:hypothetical protein